MGKTTIMLAAVVAVAMLIAPVLMTEDSSAGSVMEGRTTSCNVLEGITVLEDSSAFSDDSMYVMVEGSENHRAMEAYIADPLNGCVAGDDFSLIPENIGKTIHLYYRTAYDMTETDVWFQDKPVHVTRVLESYGIPIPAKSDDVVKIRFNEAVSNEGKESTNVYLNYTEESNSWACESNMYKGMTTSFVAQEGRAYALDPYWNDTALYYDVSYYLDVSAPNGSATLFATVCFVIAGLTIAILLASLIRPKWSR